MDSLVSRYQRKTSHLHRQLTCAWLPNLLAPLYWTVSPLHTRAVFFHAAALCDTLNNPLAAAAAAMRSTRQGTRSNGIHSQRRAATTSNHRRITARQLTPLAAPRWRQCCLTPYSSYTNGSLARGNYRLPPHGDRAQGGHVQHGRALAIGLTFTIDRACAP